jgi:hypothetical protein
MPKQPAFPGLRNAMKKKQTRRQLVPGATEADGMTSLPETHETAARAARKTRKLSTDAGLLVEHRISANLGAAESVDQTFPNEMPLCAPLYKFRAREEPGGWSTAGSRKQALLATLPESRSGNSPPPTICRPASTLARAHLGN